MSSDSKLPWGSIYNPGTAEMVSWAKATLMDFEPPPTPTITHTWKYSHLLLHPYRKTWRHNYSVNGLVVRAFGLVGLLLSVLYRCVAAIGVYINYLLLWLSLVTTWLKVLFPDEGVYAIPICNIQAVGQVTLHTLQADENAWQYEPQHVRLEMVSSLQIESLQALIFRSNIKTTKISPGLFPLTVGW